MGNLCNSGSETKSSGLWECDLLVDINWACRTYVTCVFMSSEIFLRQAAKKHMKTWTLRYFLYPSSRETQQTKTCLVLKCLSRIAATSFPLLSKCLQSSPTSNYLTKRARWPLRVCRLLPNNFNLSSVASTSLRPRLIMVLKHVRGSSNFILFFFLLKIPC